MIWLFDVDHTLFNTSVLKNNLIEAFKETFSLKEETWQRLSAEYYSTLEKSTDFNPEQFCRFCQKHFSLSAAIIKKIFNDKRLYRNCLYEDTISFLNFALKKQHSLGIFSEGFTKFQIMKLRESGILKFFSPSYLFIFRRKLAPENLKQLPFPAAIFDDNPNVVMQLRNYQTYFVNRRKNLTNALDKLRAVL